MSAPRRAWQLPLAALALFVLASCGGGGGGGAASPSPSPLGPGETAYADPLAYSTAGGASLASAEEAAAVTRHQLTLGDATIAYTARAGHLIASDPVSAVPEASFFYVAYTADGAAAATRPVTFFYNGGPGSASVWLHLGSFGPRRLATGVPATTAATPFAFVDNTESLLDVSDLVFVDAVGTGLSEAIAPHRNQDFWGVDADAAVFRDFVMRWLAANGRGASPWFLYGESYGGPRTAVLARLLQDAGALPDALLLQSPALDYNNIFGFGATVNCGSSLPSYGAIGAYYGLATAAGSNIDANMASLRDFSDQRYAPAVSTWLVNNLVPADLPPLLAADTGIAALTWTNQFNFDPDSFRHTLIAGTTIGRYDGRMKAANGTPLAADDDPSSTFITPSFASGMASYLSDTLRYTGTSTYVVTGSAIGSWNFSHAGRSLPDTVPDLGAALAQNPALRVMVMSGYHDLATPFHLTETDLARLGSQPRLQIRNYPGGHMSYLDDATRVRQKADLAAFYAGTLAARATHSAPLALHARPAPQRVGIMPTVPQPATREAAVQAPLRDPWLPPKH